MRSLLTSLFTLTFILFFASCSPKSEPKRIITVTIEPQRYFLEQLVDTLYKVETMVGAGVSPETYDPLPTQLANLSNSQAYFLIGHIGFENAWAERLKKNNPNLQFFDNSEGIEFIYADYKHGDHSHKGIDPHTWSSPPEAMIIVENMYHALLKLDPENAAVYEQNHTQLRQEIEDTHHTLLNILHDAQKEFIIYHPALSYFARDYDLVQYPIEIDGKEPSAIQIKALIDTAQEKNIKTVFIQEEFDKKNAELIAQETYCRLVVIHPLSYHWQKEMIHIAEALSNE
jgi:ABC-type metal ion transport system, periplasmic component/surface adhesin